MKNYYYFSFRTVNGGVHLPKPAYFEATSFEDALVQAKMYVMNQGLNSTSPNGPIQDIVISTLVPLPAGRVYDYTTLNEISRSG